MKKNILTIAIISTFFLAACQGASKQGITETTTNDSLDKVADDIVTTSSSGNDGDKLEMTFNNTKGTTTLYFKGDTIDMVAQKSASGIWYKNDHYELRGKGNDIELKKDGKVIFSHKDDIVRSALKNKKGQTLDMTFNNTANTAKVYLNGGEQIDLVGQKPSSGIWYKNDHYELKGKGDSVELTKDGKTIFKN